MALLVWSTSRFDPVSFTISVTGDRRAEKHFSWDAIHAGGGRFFCGPVCCMLKVVSHARRTVVANVADWGLLRVLTVHISRLYSE